MPEALSKPRVLVSERGAQTERPWTLPSAALLGILWRVSRLEERSLGNPSVLLVQDHPFFHFPSILLHVCTWPGINEVVCMIHVREARSEIWVLSAPALRANQRPTGEPASPVFANPKLGPQTYHSFSCLSSSCHRKFSFSCQACGFDILRTFE